MGPTAAVRLLEVEPELAEFLNSEEIAEARQIVLPTLEIPKGPIDIAALFDRGDSFGAVVLRGMLVQQMRVGDQVGLRLLGAGDVLSPVTLISSALNSAVNSVPWSWR